MKRPLTILIDMDDTLENLTEVWVSLANRRFGTSVKPEDITTWDPSEAFPGVSHEEMYRLFYEPELYENVRPFPGAVEALRRMIEDGHDVYILTNTSYRIAKPKMEAILERYFPFIDWLHVIFAAKKQMIRGDVLIDDGPQNLAGGAFEKLLFTAYHNRAFDAEANGMVRVDGWNDVLSRIAELSDGETEPQETNSAVNSDNAKR